MDRENNSQSPLVSLVVNDLADNGFGRAFLLGRMLEPEFRIEVVGFARGPTWLPCRDHGWPEKSVPWPSSGEIRQAVKTLSGMVEGDVILLCKPLPLVLDVGERSARKLDRPRVLDIDDWELGWFYPLRFRKVISLLLRKRGEPNNLYRVWRAEHRARRQPTRLVSNRFLQERFGGTHIPHACDTEELDPARFPGRDDACRRLGLDPEKHWVGFIGSPKPHKGIDILAKAMASLGRKDAGVLIAGADRDNPDIVQLRFRYGTLVETRPPFPKTGLGMVLSALDIAALPQRDLPSNRGQMPAKVFDAMAMKIPVVASAISDLPEALDGCGVIVPPDQPEALAREIGRLLDNPDRRQRLGSLGRERCLERYSQSAVSPRLRQAIRASVRRKTEPASGRLPVFLG